MTLGTRIHRAWQLGLLAKDLAGVRLRKEGLAAEQARLRVVDRLGSLHGLPQKIGQLLALAELDRPSVYAPLTGSRAVEPLERLLPILERSLSRKWTSCFRSIEPVGIAASIGQVHRAVLLDGRPVAVKIQYPDSASNVEADLKALDWLTLPFGGLRGFDLSSYQQAIGDVLREELDYTREAQTLRRLGTALAGHGDWLVMPEVVADASGDRVLTMTWIEGESFDSVRRWPLEARQEVAHALVRSFLLGCFQWRCLHADPHPGNYRFQRTPRGVRIGLLDFGCVVPLESSHLGALAGLIAAAGRECPTDEVLGHYLALGFRSDLLRPMAHLLPRLTRVLFEPFASPDPFPIAQWKLGERVEEILGPFRWNFRFSGPANLIFVVRAYLGLIRYVQVLDVAIRWPTPESVCGPEARRTVEQSPFTVRTSLLDDRESSGPAPRRSRHLRVRVLDAGRIVVDLTFDSALAESLSDLVPPELEERLKARNLDVQQIAADSVRHRFPPGELFQLTQESRHVRVWLE